MVVSIVERGIELVFNLICDNQDDKMLAQKRKEEQKALEAMKAKAAQKGPLSE